jgi:hypothetical protein
VTTKTNTVEVLDAGVLSDGRAVLLEVIKTVPATRIIRVTDLGRGKVAFVIGGSGVLVGNTYFDLDNDGRRQAELPPRAT